MLYECLVNMLFMERSYTLSEIKVQKLSLGRYLFKRYTFVPISIRFKYVHIKY